MSWGTITIGGCVLRETFAVTEDGSTLTLNGQESTPPLTRAAVVQLHANIVALEGRTVPVLFSDKPERNGFYRIDKASSELLVWGGGAVTTASWSLGAVRIGAGADVEFEARVPTLARNSELTGAPVTPWHAAPPGATSYYTGTATATQLDRAGADGTVRVNLGLPAAPFPRWTGTAADAMRNACDLTVDGLYVVGDRSPATTPGSWSLDNGLVRVSTSVASLAVSVWRSSGWSTAKTYAILVPAALTEAPELTILRNDPEEAVVRLTYPGVPGRTQLDVGLRRGSRFAVCTLARHSAGTLGAVRSPGETGAAQTVGTGGQVGGVRAAAADAQGVSYVVGSSRVVALHNNGGITKANVLRFDFFVGAEQTGAVVGDRFADLHAQYLGTNGDRTRVVAR